jgi:hypothetical protein
MRYALDHEHRIVHVRSWGLVTTSDVQDYISRLMADSHFESDYRCLHDMRDATGVAVDTDHLVESAFAPIFHPGVRRAVVAPRDVVYGVARAYAVYSARAGQCVRAFRTMEEAEMWLETGEAEEAPPVA